MSHFDNVAQRRICIPSLGKSSISRGDPKLERVRRFGTAPHARTLRQTRKLAKMALDVAQGVTRPARGESDEERHLAVI